MPEGIPHTSRIGFTSSYHAEWYCCMAWMYALTAAMRGASTNRHHSLFSGNPVFVTAHGHSSVSRE
jgi:hypothetical protein